MERQRPQDGQFSIEIDSEPLDVRASTTTTIWGEKVVLRLLSKQASLFKLTELGMGKSILEPYAKLTRSAHGMIVVAGPTGSGKTTTLYATLSEIDRYERNVMTIEDPVEYVFADINQIQIREAAGINFASGLKSILRQDPDVILVGEMRDLETIRLALTAAETGHLVFGTLHTTSAAKTIDRIIDVFPGDEKSMVRSMLSESLQAVISQTLLKRQGGGRVAAHEILVATAAVRNLIREDKVAQIYSAIQTGGNLGMQTLDAALARLVADNVVARDEAQAKAKSVLAS